MWIGIDIRKYYDFGIGTYIRHLIQEYALLKPARSFHLYVTPEDAPSIEVPEHWEKSIVPYGKYSLGEIFLLGRNVRANGVSVFHSPHYTLPFGLKGKSVVTVHDLIHLRFPQFFSRAQRAYSFMMIRHAINDARYVITDTEFTKQDILRSFRVDERKIVPIHLGVAGSFRIVDRGVVERFRSRTGLERRYLLFVGNTKPHKGLHVLLDAFAGILKNYSDLDLVISGGSVGDDPRLKSLVEEAQFNGRVKNFRRLSDDDLVLLYNGAEMLLLPSLYEGFGLPALEAMACGIPVIVSNAASLPEVVGDGALICEAGSVESLSAAMTSLLGDSALRNELIRKGIDRAGKFSWETTARKTVDLYDAMA